MSLATADTSYLPGLTCKNWYSPESFVVTVLEYPVEGLFNFTVAPGMTAPLGSATVPRNDEVAVWAKAAMARVKTTSRVRLTFSRRIFKLLGVELSKKTI